jgi:multidrug efflux pump
LCGFSTYHSARKELAPQEDRGFIGVSISAPEYAGPHYLASYTKQLEKIYMAIPEIENYFILNGNSSINNGFFGQVLF